MPEFYEPTHYIPHNKVLISFSAEQLNEKTEKFVNKLLADGVDPDRIYISHPSVASTNSGAYTICHSVQWFVRDKNTDDYEK